MNPLKKFVKGKLEYLLSLLGDESSQNKPASYVRYVKDLDAALIGIPKRVALPLRSQIISHLDEALESAASNEQFDIAVVEMGSPSLIVEELEGEKNVSTGGRPSIFLVVLSVILTYFGFMLFLLTTVVVFGGVVNTIHRTSILYPPILLLASLIYDVLFVTFFVRKYRRYRQSRRFRHGSF
jgi:hypothetical protein